MKLKTMAFTVLTACLVSATASAGSLKVMVSMQKGNQVLDKLVQEYQKSHKSTRIQVIYMDWSDQAAGVAQKPDIYLGYNQFISENTDIGIIEDLNKLLSANDLRDIMPDTLAAFRRGKQLYGLPILASTDMIYYNKEAFSNAGLTTPKSQWTWEGDFYTYARKLSANPSGTPGGGTYGMVGLPGADFLNLFFSYGGSVTDKASKKLLFTQKEGMKAIDLLVRFHKEKLLQSVDNSTIVQNSFKTYPFFDRKSAMIMTSGATYDEAETTKALKSMGVEFGVGVVTVPGGPKGAIPVTSSLGLALMSTCKNKSEAISFMKYVISLKGQSMLFDISKALPTTISGLSNPKFTKAFPAPLLRSYKNSRSRMLLGNWPKFENGMWYNIINVIKGDATIQELKDNAKTMEEQAF